MKSEAVPHRRGARIPDVIDLRTTRRVLGDFDENAFVGRPQQLSPQAIL